MAGEFVSLAATGDLQRVADAVTTVVEHSFTTHPMRHVTQAEVKRRTDFVLETFRFYRAERKWSVDKALSHLRHALAAALDTRNFEVRERTLYVPDPTLVAKGIITP